MSFILPMTTNVATTTDYGLPTTADEHQQEQNTVQNNEKAEENNQEQQQQQGEIIQTSSVHIDENLPEEDVLVEENVTPFYMNTGENLQQTLHRLGIDLPENVINEHNF
jgi:hypothetical protein